MAESGTTGFLPTADDLRIQCGSECVYYIAVVAQLFLAEDPPPVFEISLQTPGKLNRVLCPAMSLDGTRVVTGQGNRQRTGSVPRTYYAVCAGTSFLTPNESALTVTYEQCTGNSSLYISDTDTDPVSTVISNPSLLPNTSSWGHRLTGRSTCSRKWSWQSRSWRPMHCSKGPSPALLFTNRSYLENYYFMSAGAGEYRVTVQDGKAPYVQLGMPPSRGGGGGVGLKDRSWTSTSESQPALNFGSVDLQWSNALTYNRSRALMAANLTYLIYVIDLDAAKTQTDVWDQNIHLDTLCGLQYAKTKLRGDAVRTYVYKDLLPANGLTPILSLDLGSVPARHTISITVVAMCGSACMRWLDIPCAHPCKLFPPGMPCLFLPCQTPSVVYTPFFTYSNQVPADNRPVFGQLFIFTFWVAVTALLFMLVVGVKLMHDRGIIADLLRRSPREPSSLSTPYADSLRDESGGRFGWWGGYAQLSFTEMVDTSSFGAPQSSSSRPTGSSSSNNGGGEGVLQPSRRDILIDQGARLMSTAREGLSVAAAGVVSLSRTVGSALSDTASAALSRYGPVVRREGSESESERDIDRSTHPLNNSSYRPPSPVTLAPKGTSASTSASVRDSSAFIAMTAIYPDAADSRDPSEYTSFPSRDRVSGDPSTASSSSSSSSRGVRTAAIKEEEEDSEETL